MRCDGGQTESVDEFPNLDSSIAADSRIDKEVEKCLASVSKAFGAL